LAVDPSAKARFQREAQAVAQLSHPNVVAIHSVGELDTGLPYFVMQYVAGESMAARIERDGPLEIADARRALGEVASALAAAHKHGIIHRDIKPANILCDDEANRVLVSDFGIAAVRATGEGDESTRLTVTGMAVGTPHYMSPEQLLAEKVTERTDIYSLGLLGYELLTGGSPFDIGSPREILAAHLRDARTSTPSSRALSRRVCRRTPPVDPRHPRSPSDSLPVRERSWSGRRPVWRACTRSCRL
jgi:serine/threonine-protein kinase